MSNTPRPVGHPKLPPGKRRVHFSCTIHPSTKKVIDAMCKNGQSRGQVLDFAFNPQAAPNEQ